MVVFKWPGKIEAGSVCDQRIHLVVVLQGAIVAGSLAISSRLWHFFSLGLPPLDDIVESRHQHMHGASITAVAAQPAPPRCGFEVLS